MTPIQVPTAPQWVAVQTLAELPTDLTWSGTQPIPLIRATVRVYLNSFGPALVTGYFHAEGYLGVVCVPGQLPTWFQQQSPGVREGHFFGIEMEPFRPVPAADATPNQARQLGQSMAEQLAASDWIPDYPPTDDRPAKEGGQ